MTSLRIPHNVSYLHHFYPFLSYSKSSYAYPLLLFLKSTIFISIFTLTLRLGAYKFFQVDRQVSPRSSCLHLLGAGIRNVYHHICFFLLCRSGDQTWVLMLARQVLDCAVSPASYHKAPNVQLGFACPVHRISGALMDTTDSGAFETPGGTCVTPFCCNFLAPRKLPLHTVRHETGQGH